METLFKTIFLVAICCFLCGCPPKPEKVAPIANFVVQSNEGELSTSGVVGALIAFTDLSTGPIDSRVWNFGDGSNFADSWELNSTHTYASAGTYTVSLTVTGPGGSNTASQTLTIFPAAPVANFSIPSGSSDVDTPIQFTDNSRGSIESWSWDFGDEINSSDQNPIHIYSDAGSYLVTLTVSGPGGYDTKTEAISVLPVALNSTFSRSSSSVLAGTLVEFTDNTTGSVTSWAWDFGDGNTSQLQDPVNIYQTPGNYSVSLVVEGPGGVSEFIWEECIVVISSEPDPQDPWIQSEYSNQNFNSVVIDPTNPSVIYASQYDWHNKTIYKSVDGGLSWNPIGFGHRGGIAMDPNNPDVLYEASEDQIKISTNGGATWESYSDEVPTFYMTCISVSPHDSQRMFFGTDDTLYRSEDGGVTIESVPSLAAIADSTFINKVVIDPVDPDTVYVLTRRDLLKSIDGGHSWQNINFSASDNGQCLALTFDPLAANVIYLGTMEGLYQSLNGGNSWSAISAGSTMGYVHSIAVDPMFTDTVIVGGSKGVFKSTDSGVTWLRIDDGFDPIANVFVVAQSIAIDLQSTEIIYVATASGLYKSRDGGSNWYRIGNGIHSGIIKGYSVTEVKYDPHQSDIAWVGTSEGPYKSIDGGGTWAKVSGSSRLERGVNTIAFDPLNGGVMYVGTQIGIQKSYDSGMTWVSLNDEDGDGRIDFANGSSNGSYGASKIKVIAVDPTNSQIVYAGTVDGLQKSIDGGGTWSRIDSGWMNPYVTSLAIATSPSHIIYAGTINGLQISVDGGMTWQHEAFLSNTSVDVKVLALDPHHPGTVYAAHNGNFRLYKSTDHGNNWTPIGAGELQVGHRLDLSSVQSLAFDSSAPGTLYVGTNKGLFKTTNYGDSWQCTRVFHDLNFYRLPVFVAANPNPQIHNELIITGYGKLFKSTTGGIDHRSAWNRIDSGPPTLYTNSLAIDPQFVDTIYAASMQGMHKSTDAGATWFWSSNGLGTTYTRAVVIDPTSPNTLYAGTALGLYKSTDGGFTWDRMDVGFSSVLIHALVIDPNSASTIYAGTIDGLQKSIDGGETWNRIDDGFSSTEIISLAVHSLLPGEVYVGTNDGIQLTSDGGQTWIRLDHGFGDTRIRALAIDPVMPGTLYAGTANGLQKTTDFGSTWNQLLTPTANHPSINTLAVDPVTPNVIYFGGVDGLSKSTDGGETWIEIFTSGGSVHVSSLAINPLFPETLYMGTDAFGIQKSTNGGVSEWIASDIDGDGWSDSYEQSCNSDPLDSYDEPADLDGDFICDLRDDDVDGDGFSDESEIACGSDPLDATSIPVDADNDGICSGVDVDDTDPTNGLGDPVNHDPIIPDLPPITFPGIPGGGFPLSG